MKNGLKTASIMTIIFISLVVGGFIGYNNSKPEEKNNEKPVAMISYIINENVWDDVTKPYVCTSSDENFAYVGDEITFYGTGSSDKDGIIITHIWDFSDRENPDYGSIVDREFENEGHFQILLTVVDNDGMYTEETINLEVKLKPRCHLDIDDDHLIFNFKSSDDNIQNVPFIDHGEVYIKTYIERYIDDHGSGWISSNAWLDNDNDDFLTDGDSINISRYLNGEFEYVTFTIMYDPFDWGNKEYYMELWRERFFMEDYSE